MLTLSVPRFIQIISETDAFALPVMSAGAVYILNNVYGRLAQGMDVRLSEIDFSAFAPDDVDTVREICAEVLEDNESKADSIAGKLRNIEPVTAPAAFV